MRSIIPWFILAGLLTTVPIGPAFAEKVQRRSSSSADDDDEESSHEDIEEGTMLQNRAPRLEGLPDEEPRMTLNQRLAEEHNRPYDNVVYRGAEVLQLQPEFVHAAREGLEKIYLRDYPGAMDHFAKMDQEHPGTAAWSTRP
jgi:hypothetical protein